MGFHGRTLLIAVMVFISFVSSAENKNQRVFEAGLGVFALSIPYYNGAKENHNYLVPLPYFYYRDKRIQVDRDGFLSHLWTSNNVYLDFSVSAQVPVDSEEVTIRRGMDDIDWTFQLGPAIKYFYTGNPRSENKLFSEIFIRKAIHTDFGYFDDAGWQYGMSTIHSSTLFENGDESIKWQNRLTFSFSSQKYNQLYYGVDKTDAEEFRQTYQAQSGYGNSSFSSGLVYRKGQWWVGGFMLYRSLHGAKNLSSPLIEKKDNVSAGIGVAFIFK
ncbi:MipA/OmpV family protein [Thalassotalea ganghwensis]